MALCSSFLSVRPTLCFGLLVFEVSFWERALIAVSLQTELKSWRSCVNVAFDSYLFIHPSVFVFFKYICISFFDIFINL